jgi:hypothetical protein
MPKRERFQIVLQLGGLFLEIQDTPFFDWMSVAVLGAKWQHVKVQRTYRPDATTITFFD